MAINGSRLNIFTYIVIIFSLCCVLLVSASSSGQLAAHLQASCDNGEAQSCLGLVSHLHLQQLEVPLLSSLLVQYVVTHRS